MNTAVQFAAKQLQGYIAGGGARGGLMPPERILQQAASAARESGAAAVLLGVLNPLTRVLSVGKLGDVGFVVLRSPAPGSDADADGDLEVCCCPRPLHCRLSVRHFRNAISWRIQFACDVVRAGLRTVESACETGKSCVLGR